MTIFKKYLFFRFFRFFMTRMNPVSVGDAIAIFSASNSLELFYLCKVVSFGKATEDLNDENNHCIGKDDPYIEVRYFEKKPNSEFKKGNIVYKCLPKPVYVHPAQVMSPKINVTCIGSNIHVTRDEYQWLCVSI